MKIRYMYQSLEYLKVNIQFHIVVPDFDHFVTTGHKIAPWLRNSHTAAATAMNVSNLGIIHICCYDGTSSTWD